LIRSMTSFVSRPIKSDKFKGRLSLKTLNHRYFDWFFHGPEWPELEMELRSLVQEYIYRGRVEVSLELVTTGAAGWEVVIEEGLVQKIGEICEQLEKNLGQKISLDADIFFKIPQLITIKRKELDPQTRAWLKDIFQQALEKVIEQREKEGRKLAASLRRSAARLKKSLKLIKKYVSQEEASWREKLQLKLRDILGPEPVNEKRLEEEVAYLLIKGDIKEEIDRIEAHLTSLEEILASENREPRGRQIDFLAQELLREVSTLAAKSLSLDVVKESLRMKTEIEAIRQQSQNIE